MGTEGIKGGTKTDTQVVHALAQSASAIGHAAGVTGPSLRQFWNSIWMKEREQVTQDGEG
jgi:hypothetical protein